MPQQSDNTFEKQANTDIKIIAAMLLALLVPAALTLSRVEDAGRLVIEGCENGVPGAGCNPSPFGYTWSLLIFIVPVGLLAWWFLRHRLYPTERKAFWLTIGMFSVAGALLDILLGNTFFNFINRGAVLGLRVPGYEFGTGWVVDIPIEEFSFYFLGGMFMLLLYIWGDLYWFAAYQVDDYKTMSQTVDKLVKPNYHAVIWGVVVIALGILYKYFGPHPYQQGFPGYFVVLSIGFIIPTFIFFRTVKPIINWRAFSFTLYSLLTVSIIWEATLGVPYNWWNYNHEQMLGIFIGAWAYLPLEAVFLWLVAGWGVTMVYEIVRIYLYMNRSYRDAFFGT